MDVREKLVELLDRFVYDEWYGNGDIAEKLIIGLTKKLTRKSPTGCRFLSYQKENDYGKECSLQKMQQSCKWMV